MPTEAPKAQEKGPNLTELAAANTKITEDLRRHTEGRNFLWRAAMGEIPPPVLEIRPLLPDVMNVNAIINMRALPQDLNELILAALIEHEEKLAFECWEQLTRNGTQACGVIDRLRMQREKMAREADPIMDDDIKRPATIPFFGGQQNDKPEGESQG